MSQFEKPGALHQIAARKLKAAIISGQFPLGQPLSENLLASQLGISKTPVREALRELSLGGLVKVMPQRGTYVFTLSRAEVVDLCYLRETLELSALRLSLERAPLALADELGDIVMRMKEAQAAQDRPAYLRLDGLFHGLFFRLAGNGYLTQAYEPIADRIAALRTRLSARGFITECLVEHASIAELARQGDGAALLCKLQAHIGRVCGHYAREIDDTVSTETAAIPPRTRKRRTTRVAA